jgi:hypothetical protein
MATSVPINYGLDISCGMDIDPLMRPAWGVALVAQAVARRLQSPTGSLIGDPLYGIDIAQVASSAGSAATMQAALVSQIRAQILRDERVDTVDFPEQSFNYDAKTFTLRVNVVTAEGPFSLVIELTAGNVEVIVAGV